MRTPGTPSTTLFFPRTATMLLIALAAGLLALVGAVRPASAAGEGSFAFDDASYTVQEGGTAQLTVVRTGGTGAITITYAINNPDGAPLGGVTNGAVSFEAADTEATISIATSSDANAISEDFTVALLDPAGDASIGSPGIATVTVIDDDGPPVFSFQAAAHEAIEGEAVTITVIRNGSTASAETVDVSTVDGTAVGGVNFTALANVELAFGEGVSEQTFEVDTLDDTTDTGDLELDLQLSNPSAGTIGEPDPATLTIIDIENGILEFSSATYTVDEDGASINVTVIRSGGTAGEVSVNCSTVAGGTATPVDDYVNPNEEVTFVDGDVTETCIIPIEQDALIEGDETVNLALSDPDGVDETSTPILGPQSTAVLTIVDDEVAPTVQFSAAAYSIEENALVATITVTRSGDTSAESTVGWVAGEGGAPAATADIDFIAETGEVIFAAGETSTTFEVTLIDDDAEEEDEVVALALTDPVGATLGTQATALLTLLDDDGAVPTITYTLYFRWSLYSWSGEDGVDILDLLTSPEAGSAANLDEVVTGMWSWNGEEQAWEAWFRTAEVDDIPGVNDYETLEHGRAYWIAINTEGTHDWVVPAGP